MIKKIGTIIMLVSISLSALAQQSAIVGPGKSVDPFHYTSNKNQTFKQASVASAHALASAVGAEIMKRGGNAFDAAIATQLALAVVYPVAGNIGGGGFLLGRKADGEVLAIDFRETAPLAAHSDMYLDKNGNAQTQLSQKGHLAAGVPGTVAGLFATLKYAKLPFKDLIQPAIDLADRGFVIQASEAKSLNQQMLDFLYYNTQKVAYIKKNDWKAGDTLIQRDLAKTLKRIRDKGEAGFYEGETAKLIVAEMKRGRGIIHTDDLLSYQVMYRKPVVFNYKGHEIIGFPPPSSGGIILAQLMKMLENKQLEKYGFQSAESVQLMVEAERKAYADRAEHLGDPDFWDVPQKDLLNETYLKNRLNDFQFGKANKSGAIKAGNFKESEQTTHISIADAEGNVASITTTLNGSYGSKTVVGGAGFLLNNEMDDFSIKAGVPNMYGAIGNEANAIEPSKRMLSSMCPTLVLKNNKPYIVVGTPGGTTIPTSVFQALVNIIDFGMDANAAINTPKFHHQWLPDEVFVEQDFPKSLREKLTAMGYKISLRDGIGRIEILVIDENGNIKAVADKRGDDSVAGF